MTIKRILLCSSFIFIGVLFDTVSVSAAIQAKWINNGTIEIGGTQYVDGKPDDSDRTYYKDGKDDQLGNCSQVSVVKDISSDNARARLYPLKTSSAGLGCEPDTSRGEDVTFDPASIANATSAKAPDDKSSDSCESHGGMAWLFCPVIKLLDATMNVVDTQIQAMLDVDSNKYLNAELKQSWSTIRNIAYIVLIPITLVMVIGTAVGSSMIDAYTVKKAMPRLAIAVIFIALSYEICIFLISLFNTVGYGMIGLLTSPFGDSISTLSLADLFGTSREGVGGGVLSAIIALPKIAVAGIAILLLLWFFGTTFLLFAGAAFLVLMIRQLFIVGLVLLAPIAILAWIFPGNDKLWKSWWGLFSKLLIMFPLIMGIIAVGRIFAFIINQERGGGLEGSLLTPFTKLAAYMLPYAFIPFTFKFAGGIFANIAGVINDKEKGLFDRQKEKRKAKKERASRDQAIDPESRLGRTKFGKFANKAASWGVAPGANAKYSVGKFANKRGIGLLSGVGGDIRSSLHHKGMEQTAKLSQEMQANGMMNDRALAAISGRHSVLSEGVQQKLQQQHPELFGKALTNRNDILKVAKIMEEYGNNTTETIGGNAMAGFADTIAGKYKNDEIAYGNIPAAAAMEWARQGFASAEDLASVGNSLMTDSKLDKDTAQTYVSRMQLLGQQSRPDLKMGYGVMFDRQSGKFVDGTNYTYRDKFGATRIRGDDLVKTVKQTDWLGAKSAAVEKLHENIKRVASETVKDDAGNNVYTAEAKAMQEQIALGASQFSSSDVGAKVEWGKLVEELQLQSQLESIDIAQRAQRERQAGAGGPALPGGGGGGADSGGAGGGAAGGGGGAT